MDMSAENVQGCQMFYLKCCWRHIFPNLALPYPIPTLSVLLTPPFTLTGLVTNGLGVEGHWYVGGPRSSDSELDLGLFCNLSPKL